MLILSSCQTIQKSVVEKVKYLDPGYFPELPDIENNREVLLFMVDAYSEHLKLLISARSTGYFIDDIELEIEDCQAVLDWLDSLDE